MIVFELIDLKLPYEKINFSDCNDEFNYNVENLKKYILRELISNKENKIVYSEKLQSYQTTPKCLCNLIDK